MLTQTQEPTIAKQIDFLSYTNPSDYSANLFKIENPEQNYIKQSRHGLYVAESTYWEDYYEDPDFKYEWNDGRLEEKEMPTSLSDLIKQWLETLILYYLNFNPIARQIKSELGFTLNLSNKKSIRKPDLSLILKSNPDQLKDFDCSYNGTYDLCVEYLSDTKAEYVKRDTVDKKEEYCGGRVKEYFIIDSKKKHTAFYKLVNKGRNRYSYEPIKPKNGIIRSQVLPGFQFRVKDLYLRPNPEDLYKDDVYKSYVKVDFQNVIKKKDDAIKEKDDAIKEKNDAINAMEQEKRAKEEALKEIERLKQMLSTL
ncbi:protein containing DUF820 [Candidatus Magnetomorum sp. HK-1]|nr:protein containing DUF820 [Candidatus Magnetomorum sp. HK-1]